MNAAYGSIDIFGLSVADVNLEEATELVCELATANSSNLVVTPNADHFVRWQRDSSFRDTYDRATVRVIDGAPLAWIGTLQSAKPVARVPGVDLFVSTLARAEQARIPVAIIGGRTPVLERAVANIRETYPQLNLFFSLSPSAADLEDPTYLQLMSSTLTAEPSKIVALCLGSPKQEALYERIRDDAGTGVFLGVGAAVDFIAGEITRAPQWIQDLGGEWAFRLLHEPRRLWKRYLVTDTVIIRYVLRALVDRVRSSV